MMDSTLVRLRIRDARAALAAVAACCVLPAAAVNHELVVAPIAPGPFNVACSNVAQDASRIAPGATAADYWEGRQVNGAQHYITEILAQPQAAIQFAARVPDERSIYPQRAGDDVPFVAIVCHPTPRSNGDANYVLPGTGEIVPHMQPAGAAPKLISAMQYAQTLGIVIDPAATFPMRLPLVVYSHGLTGSPISKGYVQVMVELAAHGFMVAAVFHGDPRFSRVRIEDFGDFAYLLTNFPQVAEMGLLRPVALKTMTDVLLNDAGYAPGIDIERIGGFGASLGGDAMTLLLGARATTSLGGRCSDPVHDPRIRAAVGFVPFGGYSFLPAFCDGQVGAAGVNRPYLAMSGTADTTAPIGPFQNALNRFSSSRYLVQLVDGQHEFRPDDAGDLFTWMVTFLNAYLDVRTDPGAMARLIKMNGVTGGREDNLLVDVHVPFANGTGEVTVRELYSPTVNHYLITSDGSEADSLLAAGAGWELTGQAFKAWAQMPADTFVTASPVCRFRTPFRSRAASSFFTASSAECDQVKRAGGWRFVGTSFYVQPVNANLACPDGYLGVQRAYNNGFVRNDSNHRFTTSDSEMREMARKGWAVEGTVMCSRP